MRHKDIIHNIKVPRNYFETAYFRYNSSSHKDCPVLFIPPFVFLNVQKLGYFHYQRAVTKSPLSYLFWNVSYVEKPFRYKPSSYSTAFFIISESLLTLLDSQDVKPLHQAITTPTIDSDP
jgi:hypothetical protein